MEKEIVSVIKELFKLDDIHTEYQDGESNFILDSKKDGDTLTVKITLKDNKDKKEFEAWVDTLDDDMFNEVWESLSEEWNLHSLNDIYDSPNYKKVISLFKDKAQAIAKMKIEKLKSLFNL